MITRPLIVVKCGGNPSVDPAGICADVARLVREGQSVLLAALEVVILALAGGVKPRIVAELSRPGVPSVGLTGLDGGMLHTRRKSAARSVVDGRTTLVRDNLSGRLSEVRTELAETLLRFGFVPVVSPPTIDEHDHPVNVDSDRVAAALTVALGADQLVLLTGTTRGTRRSRRRHQRTEYLRGAGDRRAWPVRRSWHGTQTRCGT